MVEEMEKMATKNGVENSSSINEDGSEADDSGDLDDAEVAKALAPPPPRHPLEHAWTFWFDNPSAKQKQTTWGSSILPIYTISFVEDFWNVYNNIDHPSKMTVGADFHCFKNKIESKWEDPVCANRGKWTACFSKVVNVRTKQAKIPLSTKNAANEAAQLSIGRQWKDFLEYNDAIGFVFHEEAKRLDRGANNRCIV